MPFVIRDETIPQSLVTMDKWINRVLIALNVFFAVAEFPLLIIAWKMP